MSYGKQQILNTINNILSVSYIYRKMYIRANVLKLTMISGNVKQSEPHILYLITINYKTVIKKVIKSFIQPAPGVKLEVMKT